VDTERRRLQSLKYRLETRTGFSAPAASSADQSRSEFGEHLLDALLPEQFESVVAQILDAMGVQKVWVTPRTGDQGVDVRGTIVQGCVEVPLAVQAKHWQDPVHAPTLREFRGSLAPGEVGMVFATSEFSAGAVEESVRTGCAPIKLINRTRIIDLLRLYSIELRT
jgi:restriction endonuclease Mrr